MERSQRMRITLVGLAVCVGSLLPLPVLAQHLPARPAIRIMVVPPEGAGENTSGTISGRVKGVRSRSCKVVLFSYGDTWYVQPDYNSPYTSIEKGRWSATIHLGHRYAALLVRNGYKPPTTTAALPRAGGKVLALTEVTPGRNR